MPSKKDFVPDSWKNLRDWAQNIVTNAAAQLTGVEGWDAPRIAAFVARVTKVRDAAQAVLDAQSVLDAKTGALAQIRSDELPEVRQDIGNMKKSRGWDDGKGDVLEVNTPSAQVDPAALQPALSVESKHGHSEIMAKKLGADSLNLYVRRKGEAAFRLLAGKRVRFPMDDDTPPATPGQPEEREYQAIAVIGDEEVGVPSDIVSAVFRP
ncbi:MAG: hypothetical protein NTV08_00595 [Verrucomicrobia bacterium]|nr:hypothetical protein [Verrucomicrobiota bacterium]